MFVWVHNQMRSGPNALRMGYCTVNPIFMPITKHKIRQTPPKTMGELLVHNFMTVPNNFLKKLLLLMDYYVSNQ